MPRIVRYDAGLFRNGPILPVTIEPVVAVQELFRLGGEPFPSLTVAALLDTGASSTAIKESVLNGFDIEPVGEYFANTPSTTRPIAVPKYRLRLVFPENVAFEMNIASLPLGGQNVQCLIGRDILQYVLFTYNGPKNSYTLNIHTSDEE